jgi:hypothetical protein
MGEEIEVRRMDVYIYLSCFEIEISELVTRYGFFLCN